MSILIIIQSRCTPDDDHVCDVPGCGRVVCRGARPGQNRFRCLLACTWQRAAQQPSYGHSGQQQRSGSAPPCQGHPSCEPRPPDTRQPHPLQGRGRQGQGGTSEGQGGTCVVWGGRRRWRPAHLDLPSLESETLSGVAQQCGQVWAVVTTSHQHRGPGHKWLHLH